jgi:hypothetical protein
LIDFVRDFLYEVEILPWNFYQYDLNSGFHKTIYTTTFARPAHFEISNSKQCIYVSSHNFDYGYCWERVTYYWPAALDKFWFNNDGSLRKEKTFIHEKWYRFTSHKVFSFQGHEYICTLGQPNRLFFINAESMELEYFFDLHFNLLEKLDGELLRRYLCKWPFIHWFARALEVSASGRFIFIPMEWKIIIFDFEKHKIEKIINIFPEICIFDDVYLSDFKNISAHCQYI